MHEFKHPNYYKNLRKLARLRNRDQAIIESKTVDIGDSVRPGPGLKQRDSTGGVPGEADISVTGHKRQASSAKPQATSLQKISDKPQAPSSKPQA